LNKIYGFFGVRAIAKNSTTALRAKPMAINDLLQNDSKTTIEPYKNINITKKTVRFGSDVYQFHNISGFGMAEIKNQNSAAVPLLLAAFVVGLILANFSFWLGAIVCIVALLGIFSIVSTPKEYGLKLYINSGDKKVFITRDLNGIKQVVATLYEFMESEKDGAYVINIDQRGCSIGIGYNEQVSF
jgi:Family of unknown function (DUF6232)